jgi:hypothetical protein
MMRMQMQMQRASKPQNVFEKRWWWRGKNQYAAVFDRNSILSPLGSFSFLRPDELPAMLLSLIVLVRRVSDVLCVLDVWLERSLRTSLRAAE